MSSLPRALRLAVLLLLSPFACDDDDDDGVAVARGDGGPDAPATLAQAALAKFVDPVPAPRQLSAQGPDGGAGSLTLGMWEIQQQLHRDLPPTTVWAYGETAALASYPGPTIQARVGVPTEIRWVNQLPTRHLFTVDPTIHWAAPANFPTLGIPTVVHVHGGLQEAPSDGHPDAWFTLNFAQKGPGWVKETYSYPNQYSPENLWYHDHALGLTRLNVYAGLAGFYLLRDPALEQQLGLPSGAHYREILIQDRTFNPDGSLFYPSDGEVPAVHPYWVPEFFGDFNLVNGKVWPYLEVEPRRYRFLLLNAANARFYRLSLSDGRPFHQIGTDGGYLPAPVPIDKLLLGVAERAEVIIDFTGAAPGSTFELRNDAPAPFPDGDAPDEHTSRVMQFRVVPLTAPDDSQLPAALTPLPSLGGAEITRTLTLYEALDAQQNSLGVFLDGKRWGHGNDVTELPRAYTTEIWQIVNTTMDAHPIHIHLIDFLIMNRQDFDSDAYTTAYQAMNPGLPRQDAQTLPVDSYLRGQPMPPAANEAGLKDTLVVPHGQVTRILVRFAPEGGQPFPFDPTLEPGYVWHCHILEHEDNEMMRRLKITPALP